LNVLVLLGGERRTSSAEWVWSSFWSHSTSSSGSR